MFAELKCVERRSELSLWQRTNSANMTCFEVTPTKYASVARHSSVAENYGRPDHKPPSRGLAAIPHFAEIYETCQKAWVQMTPDFRGYRADRHLRLCVTTQKQTVALFVVLHGVMHSAARSHLQRCKVENATCAPTQTSRHISMPPARAVVYHPGASIT